MGRQLAFSSPGRYSSHPHFTDLETEVSERLSSLPQVTQLISQEVQSDLWYSRTQALNPLWQSISHEQPPAPSSSASPPCTPTCSPKSHTNNPACPSQHPRHEEQVLPLRFCMSRGPCPPRLLLANPCSSSEAQLRSHRLCSGP